MARTALTPKVAKGPFEAITAGAVDFTFAAGDVANGNDFVCSGRQVILAYNSDATLPYYVTIDSVADEKNREGDITQYSLAAGDYAVFLPGMTNSKGWKQTDGKIHINVENAAVLLAVITIP